MTSEMWQRLRAQLILHEGQRLNLYTDTMGYVSVGVGHNLTVRGISQPVCDLMLDEDIGAALDYAMTLPWFRPLDEVRQRIIVDMVFNIGLAGLLKFKLMIAAIVAGDFEEASRQMLSSVWASQVGPRAERLARMMSTGSDS